MEVKELRRKIKNGELDKEINEHCKKFDRNFDDLVEKLLKDDMFAEAFIDFL